MPTRTFYKVVIGIAVVGTLAITALGQAERQRRRPDLSEVPTSLDGFTVALVNGDPVSLVPPGGGVVILVVSTCVHCRESLRRIAQAADGRPLDRLRIVAGDGAAAAEALVRQVGLRATVTGPAEGAKELFKSLGVPAVPYFFEVDGTGRVLRTRIGLLPRESVASWLAAADHPR
jgi:hypothetical protein